MNEALAAIHNRRSMRTSVSQAHKSELETIVTAGMWAPSGQDQQNI